MHWSEVVEWEQPYAHLKKARVGCLTIYKYEHDEFELNKNGLGDKYISSGRLDNLVEIAVNTLVVAWDLDLETVLQLTKIQSKLNSKV